LVCGRQVVQRIAPLPAAFDPRFEVGAFGTDCGVVAVPWKDDRLVVEGKQAVGD
jgi:hypothetical protein